ncbi:hypothetical protein K8O68_13305 [Salipaludibacillus sp. CUR1]|uniref:hypothetical protein n=1 Tax=Salipaludibacillus sp. CUR1 TaxID=2820003 RepID=UPI001E63DFB1|nr:hypothetical protein [Salipaludibacillus sp. CUR1]MCE7793399.1 hypothetical protein [Salipaludibacillus sp. CUR1]
MKANRWGKYAAEMFLLYLLFFPVHQLQGYESSVLFGLIITGTFLNQWLLKRKFFLLPAGSSIPAVAGLGWMAGFTLFISGLTAIILFWRTSVVRQSTESEIRLFIGTLLIGIPYYLIYQSNQIAALISFQLLLVLLLKLFSVAKASANKTKEQWKAFLSSSAVIVAGCGLTAITVAIYPYVLHVLHVGIYYIVLAAATIVSPLINFLDLSEYITMAPPGEAPSETGQSQPLDLSEQEQTFSADFYSAAGWLIGLVFLTILLIIIIRKKKENAWNNEVIKEGEVLSHKERRSLLSRSRKRSGKPAHEVRKLFLTLQKIYAKAGYPRKSSETAEEWFNSLPETEEVKGKVLSIYNDVRYGEKLPAKDEVRAYRKAVKKMKRTAGK